jgi:hypothetical protein
MPNPCRLAREEAIVVGVDSSPGAHAVDEILTRYRGLEDDVLDAIGQPG